ncbi:MAG: hypothetical protein ACI9GW_003041 [Halieaceae bacterium]|jgi:hypothetical protein
MSVGSWDPTVVPVDEASIIPTAWLLECIELSRSEQLAELNNCVDSEKVQRYAPLMQREPIEWLHAVESFDSEQLWHLLRFYTVAEDLPGWDAGYRSPVIVFAKLLKKRGDNISRETLLWIREHSSNRFLPYGPL